MKIMSWNVNGIRACYNKGAFFNFLNAEMPDILGLQETKISRDQLTDELMNPLGYYSVWHSAAKKGYSGVAIFTRKKPIAVTEGFGIDRYDIEGRVISADFGEFVFFSVYFPNGQMNEDRLHYKLGFYHDFFAHVDALRASGRHVIIGGDYNTAHHEIDLARPNENRDTSGFLPIEREWIDRIVDRGYVDTFRYFEPGPDHYTWWTYRAGARQRNIGWRIDYLFCDDGYVPRLKDAFILPGVLGSDHCPVGIEIA